jgi:hypothetical protein
MSGRRCRGEQRVQPVNATESAPGRSATLSGGESRIWRPVSIFRTPQIILSART